MLQTVQRSVSARRSAGSVWLNIPNGSVDRITGGIDLLTGLSGHCASALFTTDALSFSAALCMASGIAAAGVLHRPLRLEIWRENRCEIEAICGAVYL